MEYKNCRLGLLALIGTCALANGQAGPVVGWGDNTYGQQVIPPGAFTQVATDEAGTIVGLRANSTLAAWGRNDYGEVANVPAGSFLNVFGQGSEHFIAIRSTDHSLVPWGNNYGHGCDVATGSFTAVTTLGWHGLGVRTDGSLACWGDGSDPASLPSGTFTAVAATDGVGYALRTDHTVVGFDFTGGSPLPTPGAFHFAMLPTDVPPADTKDPPTTTSPVGSSAIA